LKSRGEAELINHFSSVSSRDNLPLILRGVPRRGEGFNAELNSPADSGEGLIIEFNSPALKKGQVNSPTITLKPPFSGISPLWAEIQQINKTSI
jgi:hypothetical protein